MKNFETKLYHIISKQGWNNPIRQSLTKSKIYKCGVKLIENRKTF